MPRRQRLMIFLEQARQQSDAIIQHRRWLHAHPELSFEEKETTAYIVQALREMGVEVETFSDYYGCVGRIRGGKPGGRVMLRADIDALPMEEHSGDSFAATNGNMHSCGHDCHAAILLGAARMLVEHRDEISGTVELLFQSAEEAFVGSKYYIEQGYLDGVDALFGMHVWGHMETPFINLEDGPRMASCDNFKIVVNGKSAHGSTPHQGNDAILAASSIVMNLQSYVSRVNDATNPLVISVGTVKAGTQFNIIADRVEMEGTVRTFDRTLRSQVEPGMRRIIETTAQALGCTAQLQYDILEEAVINEHPQLTRIARAAAVKLFGEEILVDMPRVTGSEDFSFLAERVPAVFGFIGCLNESCGIVHPNHNDKFRVDERVLYHGAALYAQFAWDFLEENGGGEER